jgi:hypothetical protein
MRISSGILSRPVGDGVIVMRIDDDCYVELNGTAAVVWQTLHTLHDADRAALTTALLERFDVSPEVAAADLDRLIVQLRDFGAIDE